jgi:LysM repeat protein
MTELENLQSQLRESKMRLRELRTENAELKIQYRRWLWVSAGVSVLSLSLTIWVSLSGGGEMVLQPYSVAGSAQTAFVEPPTSSHSPVSPLPTTKFAFEPLAIDAPGFDLPEEPSVRRASENHLEAPALPLAATEIEESSTRSSELVATKAFSLPGSAGKPQKTVKRYVVQKNDSLWKIVNRFYGSATPQRIKKVMQDNGLGDTNLQPGVTLLLIID